MTITTNGGARHGAGRKAQGKPYTVSLPDDVVAQLKELSGEPEPAGPRDKRLALGIIEAVRLLRGG